MRAYDAGEKIKGRNRHIAVDTDGRLLMSTSQRRIFQTRRGRRGFSTPADREPLMSRATEGSSASK